MAGVKTAARMEAEEVCKRFPDAPNLQLARKLRDEFPLLFASIEQARSYVRVIRGACGKQVRNQATQPRKRGKAGQKPQCPPSFAEPWTPFVLEDPKTVGIISDVHIPYHHEQALTAAVGHLKKRNIDTLLLLGDICDFYQISRWQKDPRKRRFTEEVKAIKSGLEWLRSEFPKARIIWKDGNHEERWQHFIWNRAPEIYDLPSCTIPALLDFDNWGVEYVTDQRPIMVGKLPCLHGHELPKGMASPVNMARGAFLRTLHSMLCGHGHRTSTHVEADMFGKEIAVWSIGCLAAENPEYQRIGKQNHGCALVEVDKSGDFGVENFRVARNGTVRTA